MYFEKPTFQYTCNSFTLPYHQYFGELPIPLYYSLLSCTKSIYFAFPFLKVKEHEQQQ